ncbi:fimbrial assembly protein [Telmatobacter sp. DSM 110680]|uniref:Fimbrial assembly protein n=1 Tax=Telmatobacter sp. DSM 110680 TaxID=3036704 RepID=A0AAU7DC73_9BACT
MRVAINLASRPFADVAPALKNLRIAMGALALLAVILGVGLHLVHDKAEAARARAHSLDGKIADLTHERQQYQAMMQQPDNARTLQQAENLNQLFDEKAFSWTLAMEDLETVLPAGVQVTTLEPSVKNGQITVHLRVVGPRNRDVELVQNLEHSRHFLLPRIVNETTASEEGPNQRAEPVSTSNRVNFDMLADYTPGTSEERKLAREKAFASAKARTKGDDDSEPAMGANHARSPYTGTPRAHVPAQPSRGVPQ